MADPVWPESETGTIMINTQQTRERVIKTLILKTIFDTVPIQNRSLGEACRLLAFWMTPELPSSIPHTPGSVARDEFL
jgi:hypothetical protein